MKECKSHLIANLISILTKLQDHEVLEHNPSQLPSEKKREKEQRMVTAKVIECKVE